jgi:dTDP-4-dehydrorhamnose 3,5-epimerase
MKLLPTALSGVYVIEMEPQFDHRGFFARNFCAKVFADAGLVTHFVQQSISWNTKKGTLRGLHYQAAPYQETKLIRCTRGSVFDVAVDNRLDSPTYWQWIGVELSANNRRMVYIPEGVAHGFQSLEDETEVFYQMSAPYEAEYARVLRWDDSTINVNWPIANPIISDRDVGGASSS